MPKAKPITGKRATEAVASAEAVMKTVDGVEYPAGAFLVVEDPEQPSTWHLRVKNADGKMEPRMMGAAWAALHGGYRGNKYEGPDKEKAISALKKMYKQMDMDLPGGRDSESFSLDQQRDQVWSAFHSQYAIPGPSFTGGIECYVREVFDDHVIASMGQDFYKVPYKFEGDDVTFAPRDEWTKVEEQRSWVTVKETRQREQLEARIKPAKEEGFEGREWEITIIGARSSEDLVTIDGTEYVRSLNGRLYSTAALEESVPMWEGVKVYDNHLTDAEFTERQGMRSVSEEWLGVITEPKWDKKNKRLDGVFKVVDESLAKKLKNAHDQGVLDTVGLSIDTLPVEQTAKHEGNQMPAIVGFRRIFSVDVVAEPAAGGGFNRLIAANNNLPPKEKTMNEKELRDLISRLVAEALAGKKVGKKRQEALIEAAVQTALLAKVAEAAAAEALVKPMIEAVVVEDDPAPDGDGNGDGDPAPAPATPPAPAPVPAPAPAADNSGAQALEAVRRLECRMIRDQAIAEAKLPAPIAALVVAAFPDGKIYQEAELTAFIKRAKEAQAAADPSGRVTGAGGGQISGALSERDKAEVEFLRLLAGNTTFRALESATDHVVTERITESYRAWVTAGRPNYGTRRISEWVYTLLGGDPLADGRAFEAITTSGMSSIVKNALNLLLANAYSVRERWWDPIVRTEEVDTIDQATLVRVYGMNTLAVVNEGDPYLELPWADDEETAAFVKKGNFAGVTLESLLRDKLNQIRRIPDLLADSWYNTISSLVSGVFTVNTAAGPQLSDTGALFNATAVTSAGGHANLLTGALSFANFGAARTAMKKQTNMQLGTGRRLMVQPKYLLVPTDLEQTALQIRNSEKDPSNADNPVNPYREKFDVIEVPDWTDTNNWALVADKAQHPAIWLIFLRGRQVPELFTADSETAGAMFTNDTLRYKVRMLTFRFSATYDCAPVSDFRPLHKSNVA